MVDKAGVRQPGVSLQLSDGERSFIALICDLGRRLAIGQSSARSAASRGGCCAHRRVGVAPAPKVAARSQREAARDLPNLRFIETTHSPFILQTAREGESQSHLDTELAVEPGGQERLKKCRDWLWA